MARQCDKTRDPARARGHAGPAIWDGQSGAAHADSSTSIPFNGGDARPRPDRRHPGRLPAAPTEATPPAAEEPVLAARTAMSGRRGAVAHRLATHRRRAGRSRRRAVHRRRARGWRAVHRRAVHRGAGLLLATTVAMAGLGVGRHQERGGQPKHGSQQKRTSHRSHLLGAISVVQAKRPEYAKGAKWAKPIPI
jgi:hypothetical protein